MKRFIPEWFNYRQIPNALTLMRVFLIPIIVAVYFIMNDPYQHRVATAIFVLAAVTDWLDGFLARRLRISSRFGAFLDPVADKLMVATVVVVLCAEFPSPWFVIPAALLIGREIAISALREWMAELGKSASVAVAYIGKIKTTVQMIALIFLLYYHPIGWFPTRILGIVLFYVATGLTLWSMVSYFIAAFRLWWPEIDSFAEGSAAPGAQDSPFG